MHSDHCKGIGWPVITTCSRVRFHRRSAAAPPRRPRVACIVEVRTGQCHHQISDPPDMCAWVICSHGCLCLLKQADRAQVFVLAAGRNRAGNNSTVLCTAQSHVATRK
eukprot:scaffold94490_cov48-Phaeocystis_antarctica.AAC.1